MLFLGYEHKQRIQYTKALNASVLFNSEMFAVLYSIYVKKIRIFGYFGSLYTYYDRKVSGVFDE